MDPKESQAFAAVFGQVLAKVRKDANVTQEHLAETVGVIQSTICRIELGTLDVSVALLRRIAGALGVSPEALMRRTEEVFTRVGQVSAVINPARPWWGLAPIADLRGLLAFVVAATWEPL